MKTITSRKKMLQLVKKLRALGKTIGFVPTMGFLHAGHLSLVKRARRQNKVVIVSIFVNPTQFGPQEDFANYPRDLERDQKLLQGFADYIFVPTVDEIYLQNEQFTFKVGSIGECLCGLSRPGHFAGVAQILTKFFNLIQPQRVYMGQKDFQQTVVVQHLLEQFFFDTKVVVCPTVREKDGLAMSSRNVYLSRVQRLQAANIFKALQLGLKLFKADQKNPQLIIKKVKKNLIEQGIGRIDYVDIRDQKTLAPVRKIESKIVLALAVFIGKTRLIDNILFDPNES